MARGTLHTRTITVYRVLGEGIEIVETVDGSTKKVVPYKGTYEGIDFTVSLFFPPTVTPPDTLQLTVGSYGRAFNLDKAFPFEPPGSSIIITPDDDEGNGVLNIPFPEWGEIWTSVLELKEFETPDGGDGGTGGEPGPRSRRVSRLTFELTLEATQAALGRALLSSASQPRTKRDN